MAPLNPDVVSRSNTLPLATFSAQALVVAGLTTHILLTIRRAARSLPPTTATRRQEPLRRRNVAIFSALAFLSLVSVTTFSVAWRFVSYFEWAESGSHELPGSLWTGWYGTGDEGVGRWRLGDWWADADMTGEADIVALGSPEGFLYTCQHFVGLSAASMFFGIEGRRRNLPTATVAAFVLLAAVGSLGYALNLFFVAMLLTPFALHDDASRRHDALFTPNSAVLYVPVIAFSFLLQYLPNLLARRLNIALVRFGYWTVPLFLAFAPQIVPLSLGYRHTSKASAHRSFDKAFFALGLTSLFIQWKLFVTSIFVNTPPEHFAVYDLFLNAIGKQDKSNRFATGLGNTARRLKLVSRHPAISITGNDVVFTAIGLLAWAFVRQLDVNDILDNSVLAFLAPSKSEKHVAFKDKVEEAVEKLEDRASAVSPPKKRGRPRKNTANGVDAPSSAGSLRRSTRAKRRSDYESDADEADESYKPSAEIAKAIDQTETDRSLSTAEDMVAGGESTALALLLAFAGGLGPLAAGVLGAEVTGSE